jgi:hypothetical protein
VAEFARIGAFCGKHSAPARKAGFDPEIALACVDDAVCAGFEGDIFYGWEGGASN